MLEGSIPNEICLTFLKICVDSDYLVPARTYRKMTPWRVVNENIAMHQIEFRYIN